MRTIPLRRSKVYASETFFTDEDGPSVLVKVQQEEGFGTPPRPDRTSLEDTSGESSSTMGLEVPIASSRRETSPRSQRTRSLSLDPFWRRRKHDKELASKIYSRVMLEERDVMDCTPRGTGTFGNVFRPKVETKHDNVEEVDYMARQFSSDYSFVEVILGEYTKNRSGKVGFLDKQRGAAVPSTTSPPRPKQEQSRTTSHRESSQTNLSDGNPLNAKTRSRKSNGSATPSEWGNLPVVTSKDISLTLALASPPPPSGAPIADIELKRRRSDLISELSEPHIVERESSRSVRKALRHSQRGLAGAGRRGSKISPKMLLEAFAEVAESMESQADKDLLRREMERLLTESIARSEPATVADGESSSETEASTADESYVPVGLCQFPGLPVVVADDLSETSSFADWLDERQAKRGKSKRPAFDVFSLSNLWSDKLAAEWEKFLQDPDDEPSLVSPPIKKPPRIERMDSKGQRFPARGASEVVFDKVSSPHRAASRTRSSSVRRNELELDRQRSLESKRISLRSRVPEMQQPKPQTVPDSGKTPVSSFPADPFAVENWHEQEAHRILRQRSMQRVRSEQEKRLAEEMAMKLRVAQAETAQQKGNQRRMIKKNVLEQFEMVHERSGASLTSRNRQTTSRPRARSLQRSIPGQGLRQSEEQQGRSTYQVYQPEVFPIETDNMSVGSIKTNDFCRGDTPQKTTNVGAIPTPPTKNQRNPSKPFTQQLIERKKEQAKRQRRSQSVGAPLQRANQRFTCARQKV